MVQRWVENKTAGPISVGGELLLPGEGTFVEDGGPAPLRNESDARIVFLTADEFAALAVGLPGVTYEVSTTGRPQYRWVGNAFVQVGNGGGAGGPLSGADMRTSIGNMSTAQDTASRADLKAQGFIPVANQTARLALVLGTDVNIGDEARQTDTGVTWRLIASPPDTAGNWEQVAAGGGAGSWSGLTGSPTDNAALLALLAGPTTLTLETNTSLTASAHANRILRNTSATAYTYTIQTDAAGGFSTNEFILGYQGGTGQISLAADAGVTLRAPSGTTAVTPAQYRFVGAQRVGVNEWVLTEFSSLGGSSGGGQSQAAGTAVWGMVPRVGVGAVIEGMAAGLYDHSSFVSTFSQTIAGGTAGTATDPGYWGEVGATSALNTEAHVGVQPLYPFMGLRPMSFEWVFRITDAQVGGRVNVGWASTVGAPQDPFASYMGPRIILGAASGDTQLKVAVHDGATGTAAQTFTLGGGAGFPNDASAAYSFTAKYYPSGPRRVEFTVVNMTTGTTATGVWNGSGAMPLAPVQTAFNARPVAQRMTPLGTTAAVGFRWYGLLGNGF